MKKLYFLLIVIIFTGCLCINPFLEFSFDEPQFERAWDCFCWVESNIKYKKASSIDWQLPKTTLEKMEGNCRAKALLVVAILYYQWGVKGSVIAIDTNGTGIADHAIACINHERLTIYKDYKEIYIYNFEELLYKCKGTF